MKPSLFNDPVPMFMYRCTQLDKKTHVIGFVSGTDERNLFWNIDEFIDPWAVELMPLTDVNFMFDAKNIPSEDDDGDFVEVEGGFQISEHHPLEMVIDCKWTKPKWNKKVVYDVT